MSLLDVLYLLIGTPANAFESLVLYIGAMIISVLIVSAIVGLIYALAGGIGQRY